MPIIGAIGVFRRRGRYPVKAVGRPPKLDAISDAALPDLAAKQSSMILNRALAGLVDQITSPLRSNTARSHLFNTRLPWPARS